MKKTAARKQRLPVERASVAGAAAKRERERRGGGAAWLRRGGAEISVSANSLINLS